MVTMTNFANAMAVFAKYFEEYDLSLKENMSIDKGKLHIYLTPSLISAEDKEILKKGGFLCEEQWRTWSYVEWVNAEDDEDNEDE